MLSHTLDQLNLEVVMGLLLQAIENLVLTLLLYFLDEARDFGRLEHFAIGVCVELLAHVDQEADHEEDNVDCQG